MQLYRISQSILICFTGVSLIFGSIHSASAQYSQQPANPYQNNSYNQSGSFGNASSFQNNGSNQQSNQGLSSGLGNSRSQNRLSGRNGTSRSSRRNNTNNTTLNNGAQTNPAEALQNEKPSTSRRSGNNGGSRPSPSQQGTPAEIVIHQNTGTGQTAAPANNRQAVPKPRITTKSYLYIESSHLAAKTGEPVTLDIILSGLPDAKMDRIAFVLSYNPDEIMPVQGKSSDGEWIPAQTMILHSEPGEYSSPKSIPATSFFTKAGQPDSPIDPINLIQHHEGKMLFYADLTAPQKMETSILARVVVVPVKPVKFTRIAFLAHGDETENAMTYIKLGEEDVLGSASDPLDGMIPLDLAVQAGGESPNSSFLNQDVNITQPYSSAVIKLIVDKPTIDVGDEVELRIVLENPSLIPVDTVEFLIMYNTRVLQMIQHDARVLSSVSSQDGLQVNEDKGILQMKSKFSKLTNDPFLTLATVTLKAVSPTTKTIFKALVHKDGSLPSTGAFYKGLDILGDPSVPTDGVITTSVTVQPTVAFMHQKRNRL